MYGDGAAAGSAGLSAYSLPKKKATAATAAYFQRLLFSWFDICSHPQWHYYPGIGLTLNYNLRKKIWDCAVMSSVQGAAFRPNFCDLGLKSDFQNADVCSSDPPHPFCSKLRTPV